MDLFIFHRDLRIEDNTSLISGVPIYAITSSQEALQSMSIYRGVYPFVMKTASKDSFEHAKEACEYLKRQHILAEGDLVIATMGEKFSKVGSTNTLQVMTV